MSMDMRRALTALISKAAKGEIDFNSVAGTRVADLRQYGVKPEEVVALIERQHKTTLSAEEKRAVAGMNLDAVANWQEQRDANKRLEANADEATKKRQAEAAAKAGKAA